MSDERITRVSLKQIREISLKQIREMKSEIDWERVDALTDEEIDRAIAEDPDDAPVWTEEDWANARVMVPVELHLDKEVIDWFKSRGDGYPARINTVLRAFVETQKQKG